MALKSPQSELGGINEGITPSIKFPYRFLHGLMGAHEHVYRHWLVMSSEYDVSTECFSQFYF